MENFEIIDQDGRIIEKDVIDKIAQEVWNVEPTSKFFYVAPEEKMDSWFRVIINAIKDIEVTIPDVEFDIIDWDTILMSQSNVYWKEYSKDGLMSHDDTVEVLRKMAFYIRLFNDLEEGFKVKVK